MGMGPPGGYWIAKGANRNVEQPIPQLSHLNAAKLRHGPAYLFSAGRGTANCFCVLSMQRPLA